MDNSEKKQLGINISQEAAKGTYSNLAIITHSVSEFVIDFASALPGLPKAEVHSRIIMTPDNAKRLFRALQDNIIKYESQFGNIIIDGPKPKGTINFEDFHGGNSGHNS